MEYTPRDPRPLTEQTADKLIDYIAGNSLHAGTRLPNEQTLCDDLGVGRSTLREAVRSLISRNILEVRQGAGTFVAERTGVTTDPLGFTFVQDKTRLVWDLLEIRLAIEPEIAALAAQKATPEQQAEIAALCDEMDELMLHGEPYDEADVAFHKLIAQASHNTVMPNLIPIISTAIMLFIDKTAVSLKSETKMTHRQVSDAILRRDSLAARDGMYLHLVYNRNRLRSMGYNRDDPFLIGK